MSDDPNIKNGEDFLGKSPDPEPAVAVKHGTTAQPEPTAEEPAAPPSEPPLAAKTLAGDLRDAVIEILRELREPWHKLSERQQEFTAGRIAATTEALVERAVGLIAARDFPAVDALLEEIRFKEKGCDVKLGFSGLAREMRHSLVDSRGGRIMVVVADPLFFRGARGPAAIDRQALIDAPPNGDAGGEGEAIGPLFAEGSLETEQDPALATDEALEKGVVASPAYGEGRTAALAGSTFDSNPFRNDLLSFARWNAGWLDGNIEGLGDSAPAREVKKAKAAAQSYFRDLGRDAALADKPDDANPFPEPWPAHASWAEGWQAGNAARAQLQAADAAAIAAADAAVPA